MFVPVLQIQEIATYSASLFFDIIRVLEIVHVSVFSSGVRVLTYQLLSLEQLKLLAFLLLLKVVPVS